MQTEAQTGEHDGEWSGEQTGQTEEHVIPEDSLDDLILRDMSMPKGWKTHTEDSTTQVHTLIDWLLNNLLPENHPHIRTCTTRAEASQGSQPGGDSGDSPLIAKA